MTHFWTYAINAPVNFHPSFSCLSPWRTTLIAASFIWLTCRSLHLRYQFWNVNILLVQDKEKRKRQKIKTINKLQYTSASLWTRTPVVCWGVELQWKKKSSNVSSGFLSWFFLYDYGSIFNKRWQSWRFPIGCLPQDSWTDSI